MVATGSPRLLLCSLLLAAACGSKTPPPAAATAAATAAPPAPAPAPIASPPPAKPAEPAEPTVPAVANRPPEVFAPAWKKVGVGQTISFGVDAIDQDLDESRVDVTALPRSAKFDPITQTVTWTPTKADLPTGTFTLKVSQGNPAAEVLTQTFTIEVTAKKQPAPIAEARDAVTEALLMIRQPRRLAALNAAYPLDKLLARSAALFRAGLPAEAQAKLGKAAPDGKQLFKQFLTGLAQTHTNPRLDPASPSFDKAAFGEASWKIVAVRPRIDKKWTELRIVYQATSAPEPVFAMFRLRPTLDLPTLPPEARAANNKVFLGLVAKHLLDKSGPSEAQFKDEAQSGKQVKALVDELVAFDGKDPATPWLRAAFVALPTEARMGGGSRRNADGSYAAGDGWAWSVQKPMPTADGKEQVFVNMAIPGFWTEAVPSADGKSWIPTCAPRFAADDPAHAPGYEALCRKAQGFVDQPEVDAAGKVTSAKRDATNLFVEHKKLHAVARLALEDGRRDHGEENGMTCANCHIRDFGVRDYADPATADPSHGTPRAHNHPIATLPFQITPTTSWSAYTLEFLADQECKGKVAYEQLTGAPSALTCPLAAR